MCCQCCFQNITWSHQLIKGKNSACTLPMCVMKSDSRIIHMMICLKQYWQLKTLITILSQYAHSDTHGLMNRSHSTQGKTCQQVYSRGHRQDIVWLKLCTSISMFIVHQSVWNICTHTLIKDMQYWQFILVNTLAYSEARFKHSTKYKVSSPYHAGSWHCRQQLPWQPDPRARGFDDSSFPGPGKYMNWTHV